MTNDPTPKTVNDDGTHEEQVAEERELQSDPTPTPSVTKEAVDFVVDQ